MEANMANGKKKSKIRQVKDELETAAISSKAETPIQKPGKFDLNRFKSKRGATIANVETLQGALPHCSIAEANDFVRLHPDEENYWSAELCFVKVPIPGTKRDMLHLIDEDIAIKYLSSKKILRFSLALASKPHDVFFLCQVPTQNLDNSWNVSNLQACEISKTAWVQVTSRKAEGVESYKIDFARDADAFPTPKWPTQLLDELIAIAFNGRMIAREDHPALLRLIGAKPSMS
jgi:hypothetical protein